MRVARFGRFGRAGRLRRAALGILFPGVALALFACTSPPPAAAKAGLPVCPTCGEIESSVDCCLPDRTKCPKCGLAQGSPGCCRMRAGEEGVVACPTCGEVDGDRECCRTRG